MKYPGRERVRPKRDCAEYFGGDLSKIAERINLPYGRKPEDSSFQNDQESFGQPNRKDVHRKMEAWKRNEKC